ncbi:MAG: acylphosphatase [Candidatus Omnitrophica bacterium]|nr:acylphosphatase [Candidatus Omnitrophota bacterium]
MGSNPTSPTIPIFDFLGMKKRAHVFYSGRVQGIGFRFTAVDIARDGGITGWVKNLPDGRVEVVAEAEKGSLEDFLDKVNKYFSRYIQDAETDWQEATGEFRDFTVRF